MKKNKLGYYFILEFLKNYFSILFAFGLIIWITQAVRLLDLISEDGNSISTYFLYILSTLPKIVSRIFIIIFFISLIITISRFESHNELKAIWFSGLDKKKFINYLVKYSILLAFLIILIRLFVVPYFSNYSRYLLLNSDVGSIAPLIKQNNFNNPLKELTVYVGKKNQINEIEEIILFENNEEKTKTIVAKTGVIINENNKNLLVLVDGSIQEKNKNGKISILDFDKITLDLKQYNKKAGDHYKFHEMFTFELIQKLKDENIAEVKIHKQNIINELSYRIIIPLFIPSLVVLGFCLIAVNRELINGNLLKITVFLAGIFIILIGEILLNLSSKVNHINLFLFISPFLFLIINKLLLNYLLTYQKNKS
jgi:lipopolysaccharide export system permease protein